MNEHLRISPDQAKEWLDEHRDGLSPTQRKRYEEIAAGIAENTRKSDGRGNGRLCDGLKSRIPPELQSYRQWVAFKTEPSDKPGKLKKIPINPNSGRYASHNDSATWGTIDKAIARAEQGKLAGIGFVFSAEDPFFGVDLDECREPTTGAVESWAQDIVDSLDSYTEVSLSGTGIHILGRGALPPGGRKKGKVEMYGRERFFVVTGAHVQNTPNTLVDRSEALALLHAKVFGEKKPTSHLEPTDTPLINLEDQEVIEKAKRAKNGSTFSALWDGDISDYPSHSEADLALCCLLAFWTGGNSQRVDRLIRQSRLYRPKWDEKHYSDGRTYGQGTIDKALELTDEFYSQDQEIATPVTFELDDLTFANTNPEVGWTKHLADAILETDHFAVDVGGKLFHYANGVYRPNGRRRIDRCCKKLMEEWGATQSWNTHRVKEVREYLRTDAPILWDRPPLDVVNVKNGLLHLKTRALHPHTPDHLSTVQLPVAYDPQALCPAWHQFLNEVFPEDCQDLPWQLIAWLMTPDTSIQKAVLLLGEGRNGKSTFLTAVKAFLGKENVAGVSLHKLESDRFAAARLVGMLANICPDLPSEDLAGTSVFKALTGGDPVHAERKYCESFEFEPFARLVFSANHPPRSADSSKAFFRRWLVVPFERTFSGEKEIRRDVLDAKLADPEEMSGVLNMALDALKRIREKGITESDTMRGARNEFRQVTDPVEVWLDANTVKHTEGYAVKGELLGAYNEDARAKGRPAITDSQFGKDVRRWCQRIDDGQKRINGVRQSVWYGIRLK
jgi:putative DNA primase/helicase